MLHGTALSHLYSSNTEKKLQLFANYSLSFARNFRFMRRPPCIRTLIFHRLSGLFRGKRNWKRINRRRAAVLDSWINTNIPNAVPLASLIRSAVFICTNPGRTQHVPTCFSPILLYFTAFIQPSFRGDLIYLTRPFIRVFSWPRFPRAEYWPFRWMKRFPGNFYLNTVSNLVRRRMTQVDVNKYREQTPPEKK